MVRVHPDWLAETMLLAGPILLKRIQTAAAQRSARRPWLLQ